MCLAVYLGALEPYTQMDIINHQVVPAMKERGIDLFWEENDEFLSGFVTVEEEISPGDSQDGLDTSASLYDSLNRPSTRQQVSSSQTLSYSRLCYHLTCMLVPQSFLDYCLAGCGNLAQLLSLALISSSWNKWPLVYDPHLLASNWIKQYVGEMLIILDATDRYSNVWCNISIHSVVYILS